MRYSQGRARSVPRRRTSDLVTSTGPPVPLRVPQLAETRADLSTFAEVLKLVDLQIPVSGEHPRIPFGYLGVKWSQVQILSARRKSDAFLAVWPSGRPFPVVGPTRLTQTSSRRHP